MKLLTSGLVPVSAIALSRFLEVMFKIVGDLANCCTQWNSCIRNHYSSLWFFDLIFSHRSFAILFSFLLLERMVSRGRDHNKSSLVQG